MIWTNKWSERKEEYERGERRISQKKKKRKKGREDEELKERRDVEAKEPL